MSRGGFGFFFDYVFWSSSGSWVWVWMEGVGCRAFVGSTLKVAEWLDARGRLFWAVAGFSDGRGFDFGGRRA